MRLSAGGTLGRIPWDKAMAYGCSKGLDEDTLRLFWSVVRAMDGGYSGWMRKEFERNRPRTARRGAGGRTTTKKGIPHAR
jgi:hypothetical protein